MKALSDVLFWAIENEKIDLFRELIKCDVDINLANKDKFTPLMYAVIRYQERIVEELLMEGALLDLDKVNHHGITALMLASRQGCLDIVRQLIEHGADTTLLNFKGQSALDLAMEQRNDKVVEYLKAVKFNN